MSTQKDAVSVNEDWAGVISNVRISKTADPELYRELGRSAHRERSRRLRALALLGLYAAKRCDIDGHAIGTGSNSHDQAASAEVPETESSAGSNAAMRGLTQRMLGSLSG